MENLWETQSHVYRELLSESEFIEIKKSLSNSTFPFSPMYRSWIPKPNKPGQQRPITQPLKAFFRTCQQKQIGLYQKIKG